MSEQTPYSNGPAPYQTVTDQQRQIWRAKGKRSVAFGAIWLVAGILITVITYQAASGGGVYFVAYGPMIFGVYRLILGFNLLNKANR